MTAPDSPTAGRTRIGLHTTIEIVVLSVLWLLFSGKLDALHLTYGAISVALVVVMSRSLIVSRENPDENEFLSRVNWGAALVYPFWLLWRVVVANIQVAKVILHPSLPIDPKVIRFDTPLRSAMSKVTLGNSITLTPGTFTLEILGGTFVVHAIDGPSASGLEEGVMQSKVAEVFGESGEVDTIRVGRPAAGTAAAESDS